MFVRHADMAISQHFTKYREILVLLGARQVGKTTLLQRLFPDAQYLNVDNDPVKNNLERYDPAVYQTLLGQEKRIVVIDEIHKTTDPGRVAKIIYDQIPGVQLIITGSSSLAIKNKATESLAGRKIDYHLYPLTISEYLVQRSLEKELTYPLLNKIVSVKKNQMPVKIFDWEALLDNLLVFGLYPATLAHPSDPLYLNNLVDSVIFRDLVELSLLENRVAALSLLKLLAHQIGYLVNYSELATQLGIDVKTVQRYISIFEQSYLIFTLKPYSTRQRDEIAKMPKIYFYDNGLRNALISNFQPINDRGDSGALFENLIIAEIQKENYYGNFGYQLNFWRTKSGSEVDLVLSQNNHPTFACEIKIRAKRTNQAFTNRYPKTKSILVSKESVFS